MTPAPIAAATNARTDDPVLKPRWAALLPVPVGFAAPAPVPELPPEEMAASVGFVFPPVLVGAATDPETRPVNKAVSVLKYVVSKTAR